jgi:hypothetical protein
MNDLQYVDRHGQHSLNVQGVAGPQLQFFSLSVKWPGSVNDARVWRNSKLSAKWEAGYRPFDSAVLIGDSIYPASRYLIPMRNFSPQYEEFYKSFFQPLFSIFIAF